MTIESRKLYIPKQRNFESVDSILYPDKAFQVTVAENYPVKGNGLNCVKDALKFLGVESILCCSQGRSPEVQETALSYCKRNSLPKARY